MMRILSPERRFRFCSASSPLTQNRSAFFFLAVFKSCPPPPPGNGRRRPFRGFYFASSSSSRRRECCRYILIKPGQRFVDVVVGVEVPMGILEPHRVPDHHAAKPDEPAVSVPIRIAMDHPQPGIFPELWSDLFWIHISRHDQHRRTKSG